MKPKHTNIFWNSGFNPAHEISENKKIREVKQFENDVTKALMLAIRHGKGVFRTLKDLLNNHKTLRGLKHEKIENYHFQIEVKEFSRTRENKKSVIPIALKSKLTPDKPIASESKTTSNTTGKKGKKFIADLILESKNYYFLIESKTLSGYTEKQIKGYLKHFFPNQKDKERIYEVYWEDLYKKIENYEDKTKEAFVTNQFKEYLEFAGLSGFKGFPFGKRKNKGTRDIEEYSYEDAKKILGQLRNELKANKTIKNLNLVFAERPQYKHVWDPVYDESLKQDLERKKKSSPDLKYSLYIWEKWIGVELTITGKYRNKLRKNLEVFLRTLDEIRQKFSHNGKMGKLFFKAIKYQQLNYKKGAITNPTWRSAAIELDVSHAVVKDDAKGDEDRKYARFDKLNNYGDFIRYLLENFSNEDFKQFGIEIRLYYDDNELETDKREIIGTIESSFERLYPLHRLLL